MLLLLFPLVDSSLVLPSLHPPSLQTNPSKDPHWHVAQTLLPHSLQTTLQQPNRHMHRPQPLHLKNHLT